MGVMTTYRAFVQDQVYELKNKHDSTNPMCLGLDPWLTHVHSFPTDKDPPLNILVDVPFGAILLHGYKLGSAAKLPAATQSFIRAFPAKTDSINEWRQFLLSSPNTDLANDYIRNGGILHVPLKNFFSLVRIQRYLLCCLRRISRKREFTTAGLSKSAIPLAMCLTLMIEETNGLENPSILKRTSRKVFSTSSKRLNSSRTFQL